ncbi:MAG: IS110 family transposase [Chloroflexi bacterium]|nr:IS110 family transposase [Chloroflexota bacterium]
MQRIACTSRTPQVFARLEPRLGRNKAIVAVARKLLIAVWHVWHDQTADRFADDTQVACSMFALAYRLRVWNLPDGQSALSFTRNQMDRLVYTPGNSCFPFNQVIVEEQLPVAA